MHVGWPQGILLALMLLSLGIHIAKDGEDRPPYSAGWTLIGSGISVSLLYWGGFFS